MNECDDDDTVVNDTCFAAHARHHVACNRSKCRYWVENKKYCNCIMIAAADAPLTLQQIGDIFSLTRMRICQIEKNACKKLFLPIVS